MDVKNAFLHGDLKEDIYMTPPPSLFSSFSQTSIGIVLLLVYVDDILITGMDSGSITQLQQHLQASFHMKDLGPLIYFLGLEVHTNSTGIFLNQHKYIQDLITLASLQDSSSVNTPLEVNVKYRCEKGYLLFYPTIFRQLVESLNYLTITRPDISFAVQQIGLGALIPIILLLSKNQTHVSKSSTESEYHAMSAAYSEII
ncbi:uncharacterized protein LOC111381958 [Olea europaea var. sylvestris]|uniref:uncharacterized protein LOC111381958 n=1 Tax=Olea europaea var. sylvestris TaxID=158386 RepID=UPI000C1D2767|nr:uncharacterized protein LOC111381958 [Olea europaea var. sylvestris]